MSDIANPGAHPVESSPESSADAVIESIDNANGSEALEGAEAVDVEAASDAELADVLSDDDATEEEIEEAQVEIAKRISMKINGEDQEFDLSSDDDVERLKEFAQKGEGADQKFQEAAKMRKQMESFAKLMQENPIEALKRLGHDPDKIAEMHMEQRIAEMQKSPDQIEREKLQKELEEIRAEKKKMEDERLEHEKSVAQEKYSRKLDNEITEALEKSEMPKSPYVVKRLAEYMMLGLKKNPKFEVADAVPLVERQIKKEIQEMFGAMPEETIEKILGTDVSTKLRKRRINKMKKSPETAASVKSTGKSEINASKPKEEKKAISAKEFFSNWGDM